MTHGPFDLTEYPLPSGTIVEASAGTGKTYSVAAYVTHALATDESLRIGNILVTTYTRNAAAELRDRIRGRLVATARLLRAAVTEGRDALDAKLLAADPALRLTMARRLERAVAIVRNCVAGVQAAMRVAPSFDDLLRLAWEEVRRPERAGLVAELRRRFRLAIVDEAQDTSRLQWEFFHELFPAAPAAANTAGDDGRRLVAVGDPKQAIYGFRGADIAAYLRFAAGDGSGRPHRSLATNFRSDGPLLEALNEALAGASFGPGIAYQPVTAAEHRAQSRLVDLPPVEVIGLGEARARPGPPWARLGRGLGEA